MFDTGFIATLLDQAPLLLGMGWFIWAQYTGRIYWGKHVIDIIKERDTLRTIVDRVNEQNRAKLERLENERDGFRRASDSGAGHAR